jgi:hypothetical protein
MFICRRTAFGLWDFALQSRRLIPRAARQRLRLTVFVFCIAAVVSIAFDLTLMLVEHATAPNACSQANGPLAVFKHRVEADSN